VGEWRRDTDELGDLSRRLSFIADDLDRSSQSLDSYSWALGSGQLIEKFHEVSSDWWVERNKLVEHLRDASSSLSAVVTSYVGTEEKIVQAATK